MTSFSDFNKVELNLPPQNMGQMLYQVSYKSTFHSASVLQSVPLVNCGVGICNSCEFSMTVNFFGSLYWYQHWPQIYVRLYKNQKWGDNIILESEYGSVICFDLFINVFIFFKCQIKKHDIYVLSEEQRTSQWACLVHKLLPFFIFCINSCFVKANMFCK